jgi:hypothetical protein
VKSVLKNLPQLHDLSPVMHPAWMALLCFAVWLATCAGR